MAAVAPLTDRAALRTWLADLLDVEPSSLAVQSLDTSGDSNLMFEIATDDCRWVLRLPPEVKNDRSAHDVLREYRMLQVLEVTAVPTPATIGACTDPAILGRPFFVMEHIDGFSPSWPLDEAWAGDGAARHGLGIAAAEALADVAVVPWRDVGLEGFGRPEGFLERQVPRWLRQLDSYRVRDVAGLREVGTWLEDHRPPEQEPGILHGDYHLRNVMFHTKPPARVSAIVDWEMATIGDPMLDLGALLATWSESGEDVFMTGTVTHADGMATRSEMIAAYERRTGRPADHLPYYMALALFKLACILEGSYSRLVAGVSQHEGHRTYEAAVPMIARRARAITRGAWGP